MSTFSSFLNQELMRDKLPNISREMIEVQHDQPFLDDIVKAIKNPNKTEAATTISDLLTKRFGYTIKLFHNSRSDFYCLPMVLSSLSVLDDDYMKVYMKDRVNELDNTKQTTEIKKLDDYTIEKAFNNILIQFKQSLKDKKLNNVEIDLKKAKVRGLPPTYTTYITCDLRTDGIYGLTAEEICAIMLHEVGHTFTTIENTFRQIRSNTILLETLRDEIDVKGKPLNKALKLAYKKIYNEEPKTDNEKILIGSFIENYANEVSATDDGYSHTDSEALADQFVSRFGYSTYLVSGLNKLYQGTFKKGSGIYECTIGVIAYSRFLQFTLLAGGFILPGLIGTLALPIYVMVVLPMILMHHDSEYTISTYDDIVRRYKRLRLDMIRVLRENASDVSKEYKDQLINKIDEVDKVISTYNATDTALFTQIAKLFSKQTTRVFDARKSQQLTEDLMENSIYVAHHKIKSLLS